MVKDQLIARGIVDREVLAAMGEVPRHEFVSKHLREFAYSDRPLPIEENQTISQPYIVAIMTELGRLDKDSGGGGGGTGWGCGGAVGGGGAG